jgi:hypothetical protein
MKTHRLLAGVWGLVAVSLASCGGALSESMVDAAIDAGRAEASTPYAPVPEASTLVDAPASPATLLTLDGSFNTLPLHPLDGIGYITRLISEPALGAGVRSEFLAIVSERGSLCAASAVRPNETAFAITALSGDDPFQPGTFAVGLGGQPGDVNVSMTRFGPSCLPAEQYASESGTVVVTRVTADAVSGTFDVTLAGDAGTLQGSFDVPLCAQPTARCTP